MTYDLRLRQEPFQFSYELDNYNIGLFEPELELEPELYDLQLNSPISKRRKKSAEAAVVRVR